MSAIVKFCGWGLGVRWSAPTEGVGGGSAQQLDDLQGMLAKEAIDSLEGDFAEGNLPDLGAASFPGPISEACYWSNADVIGIQGPVGSGKTTTVMKSRLRRAIEMPRSSKARVVWIDGRGWVDIEPSEEAEWKARGHRTSGRRFYKVLFIRETYRQLWSTTIPSYLETFPKELGKWSGGRGDPVTHVINFEDDYGPVEFIAEFMAFGDDIIASMRGVQTTDIVLNEMDTMPVDILTVGIGRIDRWPARDHFAGLPIDAQSYGQMLGDMNAPDEENWTFTVFHDEDERKRMAEELSKDLPDGVSAILIEFYNQPGYGDAGCENLQNLSPSYYPRQIATMKLAGRGDMVKRMVYNKVTNIRVGDPVFIREFNRRIHVSDGPLELIRELPLLIGLDQGFKGAAVICQFKPPYHWRVYAELHLPRERLLAKVFGGKLVDLLEDRFAGMLIECGYGDMAGEAGASIAADENETWNRLVGLTAGFHIRPQTIGTNRIQPRLEAIRAPLEYVNAGEPGLLIDPSCKFLIRGFEARYVWTDAVDKSGDKRKIPDKSYTEANVMDALQYVALSKLRGDGVSPITFPGKSSPQMGHNRRSSMPGQKPSGLKSGYDILNPYGDR